MCPTRVEGKLRKIDHPILVGTSEHTLRRIAEQLGYRIQQNGKNSYTLINTRIDVGMSHFLNVPLENIVGL
jgi:hypothetical protein